MNRRQLAFIVLINGLVSLVIALAVVWVFEIRRPEAEELAALYGARPEAVLASTPAPTLPGVTDAVSDSAPRSEDVGGEDAPPAAPTEAQEQQIYVVRGGDSLVAIATRYNVSVDDIVRVNNLSNPDFVFSGQRLVIPGSAPSAVGTTPTPPVIQGVEIGAIVGGGDVATEAVQVVNDSDQAFTLQGWRLERVDGPTYTFGNVPLFPGGSVRVHTRAGENTSIDLYWGQSEAQWQSGATAQLLNERGGLVHTFTAP